MGYLNDFVRRTTVIELGGKPYKFAELTIADFAMFRQQIVNKQEKSKDKRRERMITEAKKLGDIDPLTLLKELERPLTDEELEAEMETVEGMEFLVFLALQPNYPGITQSEVASMIPLTKLAEITEAITGGLNEEDTGKKKRSRQPIKRH